MKIEIKKFGTTLISRQTGREAFLALQSLLKDAKEDEMVEVNFNGVLTFSPAWADEFLTPLSNQLGERLILLPSDNLSVKVTIEFLEKISGRKFRQK